MMVTGLPSEGLIRFLGCNKKSGKKGKMWKLHEHTNNKHGIDKGLIREGYCRKPKNQG